MDFGRDPSNSRARKQRWSRPRSYHNRPRTASPGCVRLLRGEDEPAGLRALRQERQVRWIKPGQVRWIKPGKVRWVKDTQKRKEPPPPRPLSEASRQLKQEFDTIKFTVILARRETTLLSHTLQIKTLRTGTHVAHRHICRQAPIHEVIPTQQRPPSPHSENGLRLTQATAFL